MPTVIYTYDPLDRLIQTAGIRRFYNGSRMTTEIEGAVQRSVIQVGDHVLAEGGAGGSNLLATDLQRSVLHTVNPDKTQSMAYSVYGHRPAESGVASVLGFNGERADPVTGHYLLGNGYRAFNPVLMRFNSPDSWSPFGDGGINAYGYCGGDPINLIDPTGHLPAFLLKAYVSTFGGRKLKDAVMPKIVIPGDVGQGVTRYKNVRLLAEGVYMLDLPVKGQKPIAIINAHGQYGKFGPYLESGARDIKPPGLIGLLGANKINLKKYQGIKMYVCNSANGGALSFANKMHEKYGLPVAAFRGEVSAKYVPVHMFENGMPKVKNRYREIQRIRELTVPTGTDIISDVRIARQFDPGADSYFNYDPITFG